MSDDDEKIFKLEDYKNRIKKQTSASQDEIEKILEAAQPLTPRDMIQLELIEALADHIVYLTKMLQELLAEREDKGNSKDPK
tara:strand:+ start:442 stop:687 length:246 start_codon:yes stop_codon:yes gene_type:complete